jgi:hypothetical protein
MHIKSSTSHGQNAKACVFVDGIGTVAMHDNLQSVTGETGSETYAGQRL